MKELFEQLMKAVTELRSRANAALKNMEPLDMSEVADQLKWPLRTLQEVVQEAASCCDAVEERISKVEADLQSLESEAAKSVIDLAVKEKKVIRADDAQTLIDEAVNAKVEELQQAAKDEAATAKRADENRATLAAEMPEGTDLKDVPLVELAAEDFKSRVMPGILKRMEELREKGFKSSGAVSLAAKLPVTEEGEKEYRERLADMQAFLEERGATGAPLVPLADTRATNNQSAGGGGGGTTDPGKPKLNFA